LKKSDFRGGGAACGVLLPLEIPHATRAWYIVHEYLREFLSKDGKFLNATISVVPSKWPFLCASALLVTVL
jgi:hypothetical protein